MRSSMGGQIPECLPHELSCKIPNRPGERVIPRTDPIQPAGTFSRTQRSDSSRGGISIVVILSCHFPPSSSELDHTGRPWSVREWGLWRDSAMTQPSAKQRIATDLIILMLGAAIMGAFWAL